MTIRELCDQVTIQGFVRVQEIVDDGIKILYKGKYLDCNVGLFDDKEITYIFPLTADGMNGICIEVE